MTLDVSDAALARLIEAGGLGREEAEAALCQRFARRIELYGLRHLKTVADARDLAQQVLMSVLAALRTGRLHDPASLPSFVLGTCRNVSSDMRRKARRQAEIAARGNQDEAALPPVVSGSDVVRLLGCMAALADREATIVHMSCWEDREAVEIAERVGVSGRQRASHPSPRAGQARGLHARGGERMSCPSLETAAAWVLGELRYVGFSHVEGDETGAIDEWLAVAPRAQPMCSQVGAMTFANDVSDRKVVALAHGAEIDLGSHRVTWFDAPHVPHGWECGYLGEVSTRTLFCGDLFTQAGASPVAVTESDVLGPSEADRAQMDYFSHGRGTRMHLERMASFEPRLLACMHGSAFAGDGRAALLGLAAALEA